MLVELLRGSPDVAVGREGGAEAAYGLPCHDDGPIGRFVEDLPAERCLVPGNDRRLDEPLGDLVGVDVRYLGVAPGGHEMDMRQLVICLVSRVGTPREGESRREGRRISYQFLRNAVTGIESIHVGQIEGGLRRREDGLVWYAALTVREGDDDAGSRRAARGGGTSRASSSTHPEAQLRRIGARCGGSCRPEMPGGWTDGGGWLMESNQFNCGWHLRDAKIRSRRGWKAGGRGLGTAGQ